MELSEYHGSASGGEICQYDTNQNGKLCQKELKKSLFHTWKLKFRNIFLPQGYPESVSDDYIRYQVFDTAQAFCSCINENLATQAVMKGSGVGDSTATVAGAVITSLLKDGTRMIGKIAFAHMNKASLCANAKQWRLFADVMNDFAIILQLFAPMLPRSYFVFIMCLSGILFSLVGVAGSCSTAAFIAHQAKRNNTVDLTSKDASQVTLVRLTALIINLIITPYISGHATATWTLFVLFSFLHLYANYKGVTSVVMDIVNRTRLFVVIDSYLTSGVVLSPLKANEAESVFFPPNSSWLKLGCKAGDLDITASEMQRQISDKETLKFFIKHNKQSNKVYVALVHSSTSEDIIRACYQSYLLRIGRADLSKDEDNFMDSLKQSGWNLDIQHLGADEWRWTKPLFVRKDRLKLRSSLRTNLTRRYIGQKV